MSAFYPKRTLEKPASSLVVELTCKYADLQNDSFKAYDLQYVFVYI